MSTPVYIGIDLGGTNVRAGLITAEGSLVSSLEESIHADRGPQVGFRLIISLVERLIQIAGISPRSIGIGSTGPVDHAGGRIQNPYTLPTWENVDIVTPLRDHFHVPVTLENDADVAALGETWQGAGRGVSRLLMITVGTGIGTALIDAGKIFRGSGSVHPEGGHIPIDPAGPQCYCGARGCCESLASGTAIASYTRSQLPAQNTSLHQLCGGQPEKITADMVASAARAGDPFARSVIDRSARYLGLGLVNLLHIYLPDSVVFSGGVMRSFDLFKPILMEEISRHSIMSPIQRIPLIPAQLDQQAGLFGAARAAMLLVDEPDTHNLY